MKTFLEIAIINVGLWTLNGFFDAPLAPFSYIAGCATMWILLKGGNDSE
jgi:hypothetical protein